jgi:hypothetical protein
MSQQTPINDFIKAFQAEFGEVAYKATSADGRVFTKNWPTNPHAACNRAGGIKPVLLKDMQPVIEKKRGKR